MVIKAKIMISVICLSLFALTSQGQVGENEKLKQLINKIEKQEFLFTNYDLNRKSKKIANQLSKIASEAELIEISQMDCKLCFSYVFWVLSKKKSKLVNEIYKKYSQIENKNLDHINKFKTNKACLKLFLTEENFIYEVHNENKYLKEIK